MKTLDRIKHGINAGELSLTPEAVRTKCSCCGDTKACYYVMGSSYKICLACAEDL